MNNYTFEILYSCYDKRMSIVQNGSERISSSSSLIQYMDEPFYEWCDRLIELLSRELGEAFEVVFSGRQEEGLVLKKQAEKVMSCKNFKFVPTLLNTPLSERMKKLSALIKERGLHFTVQTISAVFIGSKEMLERFEEYLNQLEIRNIFVDTRFRTLLIRDADNLGEEEIPFYLAGNTENARQMAQNIMNYCPYSFFLGEGENGQFLDVYGRNFVYEVSRRDFFQVIFQCFLFLPLAEAFTREINSLIGSVSDPSIRKQLFMLKAVKPMVQVAVDKNVEQGRQVPFRVRTLPEGAPVPELDFSFSLDGIASCDGRMVKGIQPGKTDLYVFERGTVNPLRVIPITVFSRNRIQKIVLGDSQIVCGIGDSFNVDMDYYPADADNSDTIRWSCSDTWIASVNRDGKVTAYRSGNCEIICIAEENIKASLTLCIKPWLEAIRLPAWASGTVLMKEGEIRTLDISLEPADAFDDEIVISSTDLLVVNTYGYTLEAVSAGEALIVVENTGSRCRAEFTVRVTGNKKKRFGFFG